ncbi:MAG: hypothetical protein KatS3mg098_083 [Candidatus Parcubacteria bacterium]|nr:hypothetical protein [Patescibacteria group bacterium]BCX15854.1 MAG: hypothetical protein KatS3mg098_083 [Candidatus Parcubacteria bacterium]
MDILITTSLITAFIAGVAALFAPCCVSVLLPTYLASIFKQKRTVILMTAIFFLGILTVFLPLGLGLAAIGQFFQKYHSQLYTAGGIFLIILGIFLLIGKHLSLPFSVKSRMKEVKVEGAGSIFVLGIFSGFATLCCAPVLAGVMALSVLPGSLLWGGIYSLVYALGMVVPLFIIAYFLDKTNFTAKFLPFKKKLNYSFLGKEISLTVSELIAGLMYFFIGILILYLNWTNQLAMGGGSYQMTINLYLAKITKSLEQFLSVFPGGGWLILTLIVVGTGIIIANALRRKDEAGDFSNDKREDKSCCHHHQNHTIEK